MDLDSRSEDTPVKSDKEPKSPEAPKSTDNAPKSTDKILKNADKASKNQEPGSGEKGVFGSSEAAAVTTGETWLKRVTSQLKGLTLSERQLRMHRHGRYIFTDKKHPWRGVFSVITGLYALTCICLSIVLAYTLNTPQNESYAAGILFAFVFAVAGLIMGLLSVREKDIYKVFPKTGITLNTVSILLTVLILVMGGL